MHLKYNHPHLSYPVHELSTTLFAPRIMEGKKKTCQEAFESDRVPGRLQGSGESVNGEKLDDLYERREVGQPGGLNTGPRSLSLCRPLAAFERFGRE